MFRAEHAAPRLTEEVIAAGDAELVQQVLELVEKEIDSPEVGAFFSQMRRPSVTELVVVNDRTSRSRDVGDREQIVMRAAWPAVRGNERGDTGAEVPGDAVPRFPSVEIHRAFSRCVEKRSCHFPDLASAIRARARLVQLVMTATRSSPSS